MSLIIKKYNFNEKKITSISNDTFGGEFLWITFAKDINEKCKFQRLSVYDLSQIFYESEIEVDKIIDIIQYDVYLYILVESDTLILQQYLRANMNLGYNYSKSLSINENPIAINQDSNNYIYVLFPGNISGSFAEIHKLNPITLALIEIIEININNANSMTIDSNDNIWLITNTNPTQLVRIYNNGSNWITEITNIE